MLGHLICLLLIFQVEVRRDFSYSTLLMLTIEVPTSKDLSEGICKERWSALERDFKSGFGSIWAILAPLRLSKELALEAIADIASNDYGEKIGWMFCNFKFHDESLWAKDIEKRIGSILYHYLFAGREHIGKPCA